MFGEEKEKLPVYPNLLRSVLLHHHRAHGAEYGLAFFFFLGKASNRKGQLILYLEATHFKAAYFPLEL